MGTDRRRARVIAAAIAGVIGSFVFVALGGAGMAQNAIALAQYQYGNGAQKQYGKKVVICHKVKNTISISVNAWPAHLRHGDTEGACVESATTQGAKAKKGKKAAAVATTTATAASTTTKKPKSAKASAKGQSSKSTKTKKTKKTSSSTTTTSDSGATQSGATQKSTKKTKAQKGKKGQKAGGKPASTTPAGQVTSPESEQDDGPGNGNGRGNGNGNGHGKGNGK